MCYAFFQWTPDPEMLSEDDNYAQELEGYNATRLLSLWREWRRQFPSALMLVTRTRTSVWRQWGREFELRLWFGEPFSIRPDHVDSMGRNLIVNIEGTGIELDLLRHHMVGDLQFTKEEVNGVEVWRCK